MSSHWAPFQCWHKARWFTPVVSGTKQFFFLACTLDKVTQLGKYLFCVILAPNTASDFTYAFNNKDHISSSHGTQSIYSEGLSMLMKDKAKGQDCWIHGIYVLYVNRNFKKGNVSIILFKFREFSSLFLKTQLISPQVDLQKMDQADFAFMWWMHLEEDSVLNRDSNKLEIREKLSGSAVLHIKDSTHVEKYCSFFRRPKPLPMQHLCSSY